MNISSGCLQVQRTHVTETVVSLCVFIVVSFIILFLLCIAQTRVCLWKQCLRGHGGLPVPMDFLLAPHYRLPYILVFAVMANELFVGLRNVSASTPEDVKTNVYLNIMYTILIVPLLVVTFLGLKFFPLLACVEASRLILGHCLGLVYSLLWLADALIVTVYKYYEQLCKYGSLTSWQLAVLVLQYLPQLLIVLTVTLWYLASIIKDCCGQQVTNFPGQSEIKPYHLSRVRKLFSKALPKNVTRGKLTQLLLKVARYFFPYSKYHKLPLPLLCVVAAMSMFLYQLTLPLAVGGFRLVDSFTNYYHQVLRQALDIPDTTNNLLTGILIGVPIVFVLCPFIALLMCVLLLFHMLASISKKLKSYAKKGFVDEKLPSKLSRLPSAWKYLGAQFGYFICAWFIYYLLTLLLGFAIIVIIFGFKHFTSYFVNFILIVFVPLIWSRVIFYLQFLLCKFVFFKDSSGKFVSITNQRLFNWFAYLLFLYNGIAGFISAIIRVALSALVTLLLLFRLDTLVMAKGFDFLDSGHHAFLGFYYLYYSYNNAVMHTFIHLLKTSVKHSRRRRRGSESGSLTSPFLENPFTDHKLEEVLIHPKSQQSRNRWLVAYTLIRNPSLQPLTASNIAREKRAELTTPLSEETSVVGTNSEHEVQRQRGLIVTFN